MVLSHIKDSLLNISPKAIVLLLILASLAIFISFYIQIQAAWKENATPIVSENATTDPASQSAQSSLTVTQVKGWTLFGIANDKTTTVKTAEKPPETKLKLTLRGIFTNDDPKNAAAIIEGPDRKAIYVRTGENGPGDVKLHKVQTDSIILDRNGNLETLYFPTPTQQSGTRSAHSSFLPQPSNNYPEALYSEQFMPEMPPPGYEEPYQENLVNPEESSENLNIRDRLNALRQRIMAKKEAYKETQEQDIIEENDNVADINESDAEEEPIDMEE